MKITIEIDEQNSFEVYGKYGYEYQPEYKDNLNNYNIEYATEKAIDLLLHCDRYVKEKERSRLIDKIMELEKKIEKAGIEA